MLDIKKHQKAKDIEIGHTLVKRNKKTEWNFIEATRLRKIKLKKEKINERGTRKNNK